MPVIVKIILSFLATVLIWGGITAIDGSFLTGVTYVFKYHLLFRPNPGWNVGSFGYDGLRFVFYGIWIFIFVMLMKKPSAPPPPPVDVFCADCGQYLGPRALG